MESFHPLGFVGHTKSSEPRIGTQGISRDDLRGLANLLLIIFMATNCREIVVNFMKYGERSMMAGRITFSGILVKLLPSKIFYLENSASVIIIIAVCNLREFKHRPGRYSA